MIFQSDLKSFCLAASERAGTYVWVLLFDPWGLQGNEKQELNHDPTLPLPHPPDRQPEQWEVEAISAQPFAFLLINNRHVKMVEGKRGGRFVK